MTHERFNEVLEREIATLQNNRAQRDADEKLLFEASDEEAANILQGTFEHLAHAIFVNLERMSEYHKGVKAAVDLRLGMMAGAARDCLRRFMIMEVGLTGDSFLDLIDFARKTLASKATEYADGQDRLHNFKAAGAILTGNPEVVLLAFTVKHVVSVVDMLKAGERDFTEAQWREKLGDVVNYMFLLLALLEERSDLLHAREAERETAVKGWAGDAITDSTK